MTFSQLVFFPQTNVLGHFPKLIALSVENFTGTDYKLYFSVYIFKRTKIFLENKCVCLEFGLFCFETSFNADICNTFSTH